LQTSTSVVANQHNLNNARETSGASVYRAGPKRSRDLFTILIFTLLLIDSSSAWNLDPERLWPFEEPTFFQAILGQHDSLVAVRRVWESNRK